MQTITIDQVKEAIGEVLDKKGFTTLLDDVSSLKGKVDGLEMKFDGLSSAVTEALDMLNGITIKVDSLETISGVHDDNIAVLNRNFHYDDSKIEELEDRIL